MTSYTQPVPSVLLPDSDDGFILTLIDSSQAAEEKILSLLRNNFPKLDIVGGSAADEDFKETLVSVNGETMENAAAIVFIKTSHEMLFYKENIYTPTDIQTDIQLEVTSANIKDRLVLELNGKTRRRRVCPYFRNRHGLFKGKLP